MADVLVQMPGASAAEVENLVTINLEKKLWEIDGVEHVYSMSRPGLAVVTVRFFVGEDRTASLVKIYNKIQSNLDAVPSGVTGWVVKPIEIDDVPILDADAVQRHASDADLRRVADELLQPPAGGRRTPRRSTVVGGRPPPDPRAARPRAPGGHGLAPLEVCAACAAPMPTCGPASSRAATASSWSTAGRSSTAREVAQPWCSAAHRRPPVRLRDVAEVIDGPAEPASYTPSASARRAGASARRGRWRTLAGRELSRRSRRRLPNGAAPTRCRRRGCSTRSRSSRRERDPRPTCTCW